MPLECWMQCQNVRINRISVNLYIREGVSWHPSLKVKLFLLKARKGNEKETTVTKASFDPGGP